MAKFDLEKARRRYQLLLDRVEHGPKLSAKERDDLFSLRCRFEATSGSEVRSGQPAAATPKAPRELSEYERRQLRADIEAAGDRHRAALGRLVRANAPGPGQVNSASHSIFLGSGANPLAGVQMEKGPVDDKGHECGSQASGDSHQCLSDESIHHQCDQGGCTKLHLFKRPPYKPGN